MKKETIILSVLMAATTMFTIGAIRAQIKMAYHQGCIDMLNKQRMELDEILKVFEEKETQ